MSPEGDHDDSRREKGHVRGFREQGIKTDVTRLRELMTSTLRGSRVMKG